MKTLIAYGTKYGCARSCAEKLASLLKGDADLFDLKKGPVPDLKGYDSIVVGGSVRMGRVPKTVSSFCAAHAGELVKKKLGLFICCMSDEEKANEQLTQAFSPDLLSHAAAKENFGGEFNFSKMGALDRFIVKKVSGVETDTFSVKEDRIGLLAEAMNR